MTRSRSEPSPRRPRRVIHVFGQMYKAGAESRTMDLYRNIDRSKVQFDFLVMKRGEHFYFKEIDELGGRTFFINPPRVSGSIGFVRDLVRIFREVGPLYGVHAHTGFNIGYVMLAAWLVRVPIRVAHARSAPSVVDLPISRWLYNRFMRLLITSFATTRIACGEAASQYLYGASLNSPVKSSGPILHLANAVPVDDVRQAYCGVRENAGEARSKHDSVGISGRYPVVGTVGTLRAVKNQKHLIEVFASFLPHYPEAVLLIVGDGDLRWDLEESSRSLGISTSVLFLGEREDIPELLALMDCFVLPSLHEGVPGVLVETQVCHVPAVVSSSVTREVDFGVGLLSFVSLDAPISEWVQAVSRSLGAKAMPVQPTLDRIKSAGYDAPTAAAQLMEYYR